MNEILTDSKFWDSSYDRRLTGPLTDGDIQNYVSLQAARKLEQLGLSGKSICEVGGGDAKILSYLARRNSDADFSVLDFSPIGCELARLRAERENVRMGVCLGDLFSAAAVPPGKYDIVVSFGLVEHFSDLPGVLRAKKALAKKRGLIFTVIPNLASPVYGRLFKRWSKRIYFRHVIHDICSLSRGHSDAGLFMIEKGYLGSVEFGMLSMARNDMPRRRKADRLLYLFLLSLSISVHWFENKLSDLPATRMFAPFIYVLSRNE